MANYEYLTMCGCCGKEPIAYRDPSDNFPVGKACWGRYSYENNLAECRGGCGAVWRERW